MQFQVFSFTSQVERIIADLLGAPAPGQWTTHGSEIICLWCVIFLLVFLNYKQEWRDIFPNSFLSGRAPFQKPFVSLHILLVFVSNLFLKIIAPQKTMDKNKKVPCTYKNIFQINVLELNEIYALRNERIIIYYNKLVKRTRKSTCSVFCKVTLKLYE